jgi:hypothetical protein
VHYYLVRFTGEPPFQHSALDIKTYAMALMRKPYLKSTKRRMPKRWFGEQHHTHKALDDAIGQGELFLNMLAENYARERSYE